MGLLPVQVKPSNRLVVFSLLILIIALSVPLVPLGNGVIQYAAAATVADTRFADSTLVSGLHNATAMDFSPDGRLFVNEKVGNVRIIQNGVLLSSPFVSIQANTTGERGLLGIAFDPQFTENGFVYLYYTTSANPIHNRVSRFTADPANPNVALAASEKPIMDLPPLTGLNGFHNAGAIHFGKDGKLYVAVGDDHNPTNSQSLATDFGKMLRINSDGTIPQDNPFFNTSGARKEIWALGLRNPFTFAFSPAIDSKLMYINDVGEETWEEIDSGTPGANYGWPVCEGRCSPPNSAFVDPIYTYNHNGTHAAITGAAFYESSQFPPEYKGSYFFGDYVQGFINRITPNNQIADFLTNADSPVDIKIASDGSLYYLSYHGGQVHKVQFVPQTIPPSATLTINSVGYTNNISSVNQIQGLYTVLLSQNGTTIATGFTPSRFTLNSGQPYIISPVRFGNLVFDHWQDNNSTIRNREISITTDTQLTTVYRDITLAPTPDKSQIFVSTIDNTTGSEIRRLYTTLWQNGNLVQDGFSEMSFIVNNNQTYSVAVSDFGNFVFDHWSDGTTSRFHDVTTGNHSITKLTAVYKITTAH
jgi:glucose/arabinose dehydrogenase